ncbi:MAG: diguanylate cyclase, partial [Oscillospiraceae bacterium]
MQIKQSGNADAMPGLISSIAAIIIATLIMKYKREAFAHVDHIEEQRRKLERSEKKLYDQAYKDVLTGQPNRFFAIEKVNHNIEIAKVNGTKVGVIFIDLDSFKIINDTLGHSAGDEVLLKIAKRLDTLLANHHTVSRFGGDEFIIICSDINEVSEIEDIATAILKKITEPISVYDEQFNLTGSVGISIYPGGGGDSEELIANADMAMYEAKKQGKNRYMFFDNEMRRVINRRNGLINHLHHAIEKDELYLEYQPQINTITKEINGLEVLLRWNNAEYGKVSPGEFIPLAERTGLIKKIGLWVFETTCLEYQKHSEIYESDLKLALNFSSIQIMDNNTINELVESLQRTGMKPQNIEIEITESVGLAHETVAVDNLNKLRKIGFTIAIDDFGKEYSSLMLIRHLPLDVIKIDME